MFVALACLAVVFLYVRNQDMAGEPDAMRGDGIYRPVLARGDGHMLYLMARSTALDLDWNFTNDLARFGDPWSEPVSKITHRKEIVHPIGPALVWTPLIWIASGAAVVANVFGAQVPLHGYTLWAQRFVFLSSALFGCLAVLLARRLAQSLKLGTWAPSYSAVAILLGTSLTYYSTYMPSYSHAMDAAACAAFLAYWAATLGRTDIRRSVGLGVLLGVATLIRIQELPLGIVLVVELAGHATRARTRADWRSVGGWVARAALTLVIALVAFVPQLVEWYVVFGKIAVPQGARYTRMTAPMIGELLFSARNGWFSSTPLAYLGCVGLAFVPRQHRTIAIGLALVVITQIYLNSTIVDWWAGSSFGQRRLCSVTLPLVVGLAALIAAGGRLVAQRGRAVRVACHVLLVLVLAAFVGWNLKRVRALRGGKGAGAERVSSCCADIPKILRGPATWIYKRVGDPFQFPANALFAVRHHVPMQRWDEIVGDYPLIPAFGDIRTERLWQTTGIWRIGSPNLTGFLPQGWSRPYRSERLYRFTLAPAATVLVPNLMPYRQHLTLYLAAHEPKIVTLEWNGEVVANASVGTDWAPVSFDISGELHTNELTIRANVGPLSGPPNQALHVPDQPLGVAVSDLEISLIPDD